MTPLACPKCGSALVRRARRASLVDRLLSLGFIYPFRCGHCFRRFRAFRRGVWYSRRAAE